LHTALILNCWLPLYVGNVQVLMRLHAKRQIMSNMVAFLKNEDEFTETIMATLHAAEDHGIDPEFIQRGEWWGGTCHV
jgi:hypothetical protein